MEYPAWMYSKTEAPKLVQSAEEVAALKGKWYDSPAFEDASPGGPAAKKAAAAAAPAKPVEHYPMLLWNAEGKHITVKDQAEAAEKKLHGWAESPAGPFGAAKPAESKKDDDKKDDKK